MLTGIERLPLADAPFGISNGHVALLISILAIIYAINRWRKNTVIRRKDNPAPAAVTGHPLNVREVSAEIAALLSEVEETARRLTAQIDNRYMRLEQLVAEADEKIRRLEELTSRQASAPTAGVTSASRLQVAASTRHPEPQHAGSDAQRVLSRLRQERGAPPASQDPAYQPIYALADGGKSPREIAQQLGRQPGEIELILALRGR